MSNKVNLFVSENQEDFNMFHRRSKSEGDKIVYQANPKGGWERNYIAFWFSPLGLGIVFVFFALLI